MKKPAPKPSSQRQEVRMAFRCDSDLRDAVEACARDDQRTVSNWIAVTLRRVVEDARKGRAA